MTTGEENDLVWRRSPYCPTGSCIEIAFDNDAVLLRNSRHPAAPPLIFTTQEWQAFAQWIKSGDQSLRVERPTP